MELRQFPFDSQVLIHVHVDNFLEIIEFRQFYFDQTVTICVFQDLTVTICVFQDLTVTIVADRPHTEVQLVEDTEEPSSINTQSFVDEQEWT